MNLCWAFCLIEYAVPVNALHQKKEKEWVISRILFPLRDHGHFTVDTDRPASLATYPKTSGGPPSIVFLFGLAPDGVYPALHVTIQAVSSYLAISPLPGLKDPAVYFLWHFPPVTRRSRYEPSCPAEFGLSSPASNTEATIHPLLCFL